MSGKNLTTGCEIKAKKFFKKCWHWKQYMIICNQGRKQKEKRTDDRSEWKWKNYNRSKLTEKGDKNYA